MHSIWRLYNCDSLVLFPKGNLGLLKSVGKLRCILSSPLLIRNGISQHGKRFLLSIPIPLLNELKIALQCKLHNVYRKNFRFGFYGQFNHGRWTAINLELHAVKCIADSHNVVW